MPLRTRGALHLLALGLLDATHLLHPVLALLPLLARHALRLAHAKPRQPVLRLVLLGGYQAVVDHAEAGAPPAAEGDLEAIQQDAAGVSHLVHVADLRFQVRLGHARKARVDDLNQKLPPLQQAVGDELLRANGDRGALSPALPPPLPAPPAPFPTM